MCAFKEGVKYRELVLKFGGTGDMTLARMMEIATRYANGKKKIDSVAGRANQSVKRPVEVTPVGNRSVRPSQRHLERLRQ